VGESTRVEFLNQVMKNILGDDEDFVDLYFRLKEASMNYLAETSGGRVFYPEELRTLGEGFVQIARELKTQYVLTFRPPDDSEGSFHKIKVTCTQPVDKLYHRQIYKVP
jgi:hypothetical protein